ncbi:GAF and ANTAR domain-containing protein [Herbiconiux sp. VKM Ac-2851]|uniref:GAF and ANTAR domain-containing protein n=1 Tax=Herbiconiux sp. VKM Ac-2851 TaxID=2739025 RepID=UPI001564534A|nr:GAF and ANTAR domain-containing protein [Herbiconiux sp. VKM Ac-2851]NQX37061.1 GAF and ANTAR domain-containing protein [Herbiconiux sp. VKM Ac-2851]
MSGSFSDTLDLLRHYTGDEASIADLIAPHFSISSVSVMTLGILPATTVSATDPLAARVDELQLDLGEGPAWDTLHESLPVLEPNLRDAPQRVWTAFSEAIAREDVRAMFVFPLRIGHLDIGAITFLSRTPMELTAEQGTQAEALARTVSALLLRRALERASDSSDPLPELHSRRTIHQATGMVIVQADVSAVEAELLIRGHAFAENTTMRHVAAEILERRLTFEPLSMGSEDR